MEAGGVELVALVERGEPGLVHDGEFFTKTQPARIRGRVVGGVLLQDPPLEGVLPPLVLQLPEISQIYMHWQHFTFTFHQIYIFALHSKAYTGSIFNQITQM